MGGKEISYKNGSLLIPNEEAGVLSCCSDEPCYILWIQIPVSCVISWHFQGLLNSLLWIVVAVRALLLKNCNDSVGTNKGRHLLLDGSSLIAARWWYNVLDVLYFLWVVVSLKF